MTSTQQIVKEIVEEALEESDSVSKFYVIEEIKNRVSSTILFNKILNYDEERWDSATKDGLRNLQLGAQKAYRDAKSGLLYRDFIEVNNKIRRRTEADSVDESVSELFLRLMPLNDFIDRSSIREKFCDELSVKQAIAAAETRLQWENKDLAKKGKPVMELTEDEKISKGRNIIFNNTLSNLVKTGYIEKKGKHRNIKIKRILCD